MKISNIKNKKCPVLDYIPLNYFRNTTSLKTRNEKNVDLLFYDDILIIPKNQYFKSIMDNYQYIEIKIDLSKEGILRTKKYLKSIMNFRKWKSAIIIKDMNGVALDFILVDFNKGLFESWNKRQKDSLKAGHKLYNASKDFKLRQARGRDRVYRFKCQAMGIKG